MSSASDHVERQRRLQLQQRQREEEFVRRLQASYSKTCCRLGPYKDAIEFLQQVLLWKRPLVSAGVLVAVHMTLWYIASTEETLLTLIANVGFWLILADAFWKAANRRAEGGSGQEERQGSAASRLRARLTWRQRGRETEHRSFVEAYQMTQRPLESHELVPFEVVCFKLAEIEVWLSYLKLALHHWSTQQPFLVPIFIGSLGAVLTIVGYLISFTALLYIVVMSIIVAPAVLHYNLLDRTSQALQQWYPAWVDRATHWYNQAKRLLTPPPEEEYADIQLQPAAAGDGSAGTQPPYNPHYNDPSMTLPPFNAADNPMESLLSFTPQPEFMSINTFFQHEDSSSTGRPLQSINEVAEVGTEAVHSNDRVTPSQQTTTYSPPLIDLTDDDDAYTVQYQSTETTSSSGEGLSPVSRPPSYYEATSTSESEPLPPIDWQKQPVNTSTPLGGGGEGGASSILRHREKQQ